MVIRRWLPIVSVTDPKFAPLFGQVTGLVVTAVAVEHPFVPRGNVVGTSVFLPDVPFVNGFS
jgi:hypothetical protein